MRATLGVIALSLSPHTSTQHNNAIVKTVSHHLSTIRSDPKFAAKKHGQNLNSVDLERMRVSVLVPSARKDESVARDCASRGIVNGSTGYGRL